MCPHDVTRLLHVLENMEADIIILGVLKLLRLWHISTPKGLDFMIMTQVALKVLGRQSSSSPPRLPLRRGRRFAA
jgi:hypothetical protein